MVRQIYRMQGIG